MWTTPTWTSYRRESCDEPVSLVTRRAFVTRANTGIGRAFAQALAALGARVTRADEADETVAMIHAAGGAAETYDLDLLSRWPRDTFAEGEYSILVNKAGIIRRDDSLDLTEADWGVGMTINLKAVFFTAQAFARRAPDP